MKRAKRWRFGIKISLPWPATPFCTGTGIFRTGTGTVGLNGDTTVVSGKTLTVATYTNVFWLQNIGGRSASCFEVAWNFWVNFELLHFSFCMLQLAGKSGLDLQSCGVHILQAIQCDQASASVGDTFCKATR